MKSYRLLIAETKTDFSKDLYEAIGVSLLNTIICSYPLYLIYKHDLINNSPLRFVLCMFVVVVVAPFLYALAYKKLSDSNFFGKFCVTPTKTAWDSLFSNRECYYVIVTLKSGRKIAGKYEAKSFSSTYPCPQEIYIEEVYRLKEDGCSFGSKIEQTKGILITENEISTIEFFKD
jgi:hypothetical protein